MPTLVGAGVSVITTIIMFNLSQRAERKRKYKEGRLRVQASAFGAQMKLANILGWYQAVKRVLGETETSTTNEIASLSSIVAPTQVVERFVTDELAIAVESGDIDLVGRMLAVHSNYLTALHVLEQHQRKVDILSSFLNDSAANARYESDTFATFGNMATRGARTGEIRSELITIKEELLESVNFGLGEVTTTARRLHTAANSIDGVELKIVVGNL